jgi:hypothetical protein
VAGTGIAAGCGYDDAGGGYDGSDAAGIPAGIGYAVGWGAAGMPAGIG